MLGQISACLATLYLRGIPRAVNPNRRRWRRVESCLRLADCDLASCSDSLQSAGFIEEALVVSSPQTLDAALAAIESDRVITAVDPGYPSRWLDRLGEAAPPALWRRGPLPATTLVGIVGSRHIDAETRSFAEAVGSQVAELGCAVVSGGATGCDLAGVKGSLLAGGYALEVLPHGIESYFGEGKCGLSVCPPSEPFSTANAMERNTLIYAAAEQTVIVHARFKEGGTWLGAMQALRRKLCPLIVRADGSEASRALIGLGGIPLEEPARLREAIATSQAQRGLFGVG